MKTKLFKRFFTINERQRKNFFKITKIIFINKEFEFFEMLQKVLITKTYLYYYNFKRQLYVDLDKSKRYEFEIMIYYVFKDSQSSFFFKNRHLINFFLIQIVQCRETSLLINKIESRNLNMNFEENFTHVKSAFRKKNDYFYESFYNNEHRIISHSFFLFFE